MLEKLNDAPFLIKIDVCKGFINSLSYLWLGCFLLQHSAQQFQQIQAYIVISVSSYLTKYLILYIWYSIRGHPSNTWTLLLNKVSVVACMAIWLKPLPLNCPRGLWMPPYVVDRNITSLNIFKNIEYLEANITADRISWFSREDLKWINMLK